ncbi:hypothetical protein HDU97_000856 [Phlyctochytrium planicorne]|nr:hypothetical protein HDU97_000856 [Phlyctochytrium planicorne]
MSSQVNSTTPSIIPSQGRGPVVPGPVIPYQTNRQFASQPTPALSMASNVQQTATTPIIPTISHGNRQITIHTSFAPIPPNNPATPTTPIASNVPQAVVSADSSVVDNSPKPSEDVEAIYSRNREYFKTFIANPPHLKTEVFCTELAEWLNDKRAYLKPLHADILEVLNAIIHRAEPGVVHEKVVDIFKVIFHHMCLPDSPFIDSLEFAEEILKLSNLFYYKFWPAGRLSNMAMLLASKSEPEKCRKRSRPIPKAALPELVEILVKKYEGKEPLKSQSTHPKLRAMEGLHVTVNGVPCVMNDFLPAYPTDTFVKSDGDTVVGFVDLSPHIRSNINVVSLVDTTAASVTHASAISQPIFEHWSFSIEVWRFLPNREVLQRVVGEASERKGGILSIPDALQMQSTKSETKWFRVQLNCPISGKRIKVPVSGRECMHVNSFDLLSLIGGDADSINLAMDGPAVSGETQLALRADVLEDENMRYRQFSCPICKRCLELQNLRINDLGVYLASKAPENVDWVDVQSSKEGIIEIEWKVERGSNAEVSLSANVASQKIPDSVPPTKLDSDTETFVAVTSQPSGSAKRLISDIRDKFSSEVIASSSNGEIENDNKRIRLDEAVSAPSFPLASKVVDNLIGPRKRSVSIGEGSDREITSAKKPKAFSEEADSSLSMRVVAPKDPESHPPPHPLPSRSSAPTVTNLPAHLPHSKVVVLDSPKPHSMDSSCLPSTVVVLDSPKARSSEDGQASSKFIPAFRSANSPEVQAPPTRVLPIVESLKSVSDGQLVKLNEATMTRSSNSTDTSPEPEFLVEQPVPTASAAQNASVSASIASEKSTIAMGSKELTAGVSNILSTVVSSNSLVEDAIKKEPSLSIGQRSSAEDVFTKKTVDCARDNNTQASVDSTQMPNTAPDNHSTLNVRIQSDTKIILNTQSLPKPVAATDALKPLEAGISQQPALPSATSTLLLTSAENVRIETSLSGEKPIQAKDSISKIGVPSLGSSPASLIETLTPKSLPPLSGSSQKPKELEEHFARLEPRPTIRSDHVNFQAFKINNFFNRPMLHGLELSAEESRLLFLKLKSEVEYVKIISRWNTLANQPYQSDSQMTSLRDDIEDTLNKYLHHRDQLPTTDSDIPKASAPIIMTPGATSEIRVAMAKPGPSSLAVPPPPASSAITIQQQAPTTPIAPASSMVVWPSPLSTPSVQPPVAGPPSGPPSGPPGPISIVPTQLESNRSGPASQSISRPRQNTVSPPVLPNAPITQRPLSNPATPLPQRPVAGSARGRGRGRDGSGVAIRPYLGATPRPIAPTPAPTLAQTTLGAFNQIPRPPRPPGTINQLPPKPPVASTIQLPPRPAHLMLALQAPGPLGATLTQTTPKPSVAVTDQAPSRPQSFGSAPTSWPHATPQTNPITLAIAQNSPNALTGRSLPQANSSQPSGASSGKPTGAAIASRNPQSNRILNPEEHAEVSASTLSLLAQRLDAPKTPPLKPSSLRKDTASKGTAIQSHALDQTQGAGSISTMPLEVLQATNQNQLKPAELTMASQFQGTAAEEQRRGPIPIGTSLLQLADMPSLSHARKHSVDDHVRERRAPSDASRSKPVNSMSTPAPKRGSLSQALSSRTVEENGGSTPTEKRKASLESTNTSTRVVPSNSAAASLPVTNPSPVAGKGTAPRNSSNPATEHQTNGVSPKITPATPKALEGSHAAHAPIETVGLKVSPSRATAPRSARASDIAKALEEQTLAIRKVEGRYEEEFADDDDEWV